MNKLLSAGFARIRRDKLFWVSMIFMAGMAAFVVIINYFDQVRDGFVVRLDSYFLGCFLFVCVTMPVFCSLFLGTEYSDGTIRNKLIAGHARSTVYLSNLTLAFLSGVLMCLAYVASVSAVGVPLLGGLETRLDVVFACMLCGFVTLAAIASIYTLIAMLCHNKAATAVVSILLAVLFFILLIGIANVLEAQEFVSQAIINSEGHFEVEQVQNMNYPSETKLAIYTFFFDFLPTGQAYKIANLSAERLWRLPLLSLLIVLGATAGGLFFFGKKDLK